MEEILINGYDTSSIVSRKEILHSSVHMKDLGHTTYFLDWKLLPTATGIILSQYKYSKDLTEMAHLSNTKTFDTPIELNVRYTKNLGETILGPTLYRTLVGRLIYLLNTRPDIPSVIQIVSQFMSDL